MNNLPSKNALDTPKYPSLPSSYTLTFKNNPYRFISETAVAQTQPDQIECKVHVRFVTCKVFMHCMPSFPHF